MLDDAALSALAAVVHEGSFERAAQALHVTPSAISQRVRALEERVGCSPVVRDKPCRPTEAGRRLCRHLDRVRLLDTPRSTCRCIGSLCTRRRRWSTT
jgi:LysR family transcriptional regulator (chromosome initiation inhibitor)